MTSTPLTPVLLKLARQLSTLNHQYLDHLGLGTGQAAILRVIVDHYGITVIEIARLMKLDKSTVSRAVKRLADARYIKKRSNPHDRRSCRLVATRLATALQSLFDEVDRSVEQDLLRGLDEVQQGEFGDLLRHASAHVDHVLHSPPGNRISWLMSRAAHSR